MTHLLVTNDFPPKVGGIQVYLWELWRRLDPATFAVLTASSHPDAARFDEEQAARGVRIERAPGRVLLPTPDLVRRIRDSAERVGADTVVLDPALPLGLVGPRLGLPYAVLLHGAEVAIPGRLPGSRELLARVLRQRLHRRGIRTGITCVYSVEPARNTLPHDPADAGEHHGTGRPRTPIGTISYLPALFGLRIAQEVLERLTGAAGAAGSPPGPPGTPGCS